MYPPIFSGHSVCISCMSARACTKGSGSGSKNSASTRTGFRRRFALGVDGPRRESQFERPLRGLRRESTTGVTLRGTGLTGMASCSSRLISPRNNGNSLVRQPLATPLLTASSRVIKTGSAHGSRTSGCRGFFRWPSSMQWIEVVTAAFSPQAIQRRRAQAGLR